jgi:hypothetical protein
MPVRTTIQPIANRRYKDGVLRTARPTTNSEAISLV